MPHAAAVTTCPFTPLVRWGVPHTAAALPCPIHAVSIAPHPLFIKLSSCARLLKGRRRRLCLDCSQWGGVPLSRFNRFLLQMSGQDHDSPLFEAAFALRPELLASDIYRLRQATGGMQMVRSGWYNRFRKSISIRKYHHHPVL